MGNCLVTKLKGTVDNDNLLKYGEFILNVNHANTEDSMILRISSHTYKSEIEVRGIGGTVTELEVSPAAPFKKWLLGTGNFEVRIASKYKIDGMFLERDNGINYNPNSQNYVECNFDKYLFSNDYAFATNSIYYYMDMAALSDKNADEIIMMSYVPRTKRYLTGNINDIPVDNIRNLIFQDLSEDLVGDISHFANAPKLLSLKFSAYPNTISNITGNIASLATVLSLTGDVTFARTKVTGNVEDMLKGMFTNGRRSGKFSFYGTGYAYLNGQLMTQDWTTCTFSDSGVTITKRTDSSLVATYTAATDSWTYA